MITSFAPMDYEYRFDPWLFINCLYMYIYFTCIMALTLLKYNVYLACRGHGLSSLKKKFMFNR